MATNYVLVDFENVQPDSLAALAGGAFRIKVFVGAAQARGRISFELSHSMQMLGANAEYVTIARSGHNAVDMHIAYFTGRLVEKEPNAVIYIVSRDTDFDPLVEYLQAAGVTCKRVKTIAEIARTLPKPRPQPPARTGRSPNPPARKPNSDKLAPIIKHLHSLSGKPATRRKLAQTIANYFRQHGGALPDTAIEQLIEELIRMKYVTQSGTKVSYHLSQ
ncbi:MAG TPA: PIN domain-containing protein [Steroidobacteraceae bacterium]|nr:PIN domain-containing protein [Steroidobacteraceae bacterium]